MFSELSAVELSAVETQLLIDYARRKYAEERWPLATELRPIREALAKLDPNSEPAPALIPKPYVPSILAKRKRRH